VLPTNEIVLDRALEVAIDVARQAGALLRERWGQVLRVEHKGEINLVTEADREAERLIVERLRAAFPHHRVLAEEGTNHDGEAEYRWIVDPLDGTTNYARGYPMFCVSVALERAGRVALGVVYQPILDELFVARRGGGAWLNGDRLRVSTTNGLEKAFLATGFPYDRALFDEPLRQWSAFSYRALAVRRDGAAALNLCYVAAGRFDGFWERPLQPWDMAAGSLMVEEAGGQVSDFRAAGDFLRRREIVASNGRLHSAMLAVLAETAAS
jgi:myo-inositol-1(or 4)-monophosphatase